VERLVVGVRQRAVRKPVELVELKVFLGCGLRRVSDRGLRRDGAGEDTAEIRDAQKKDEQKRKDEAELNKSLSPGLGVDVVVPPWSGDDVLPLDGTSDGLAPDFRTPLPPYQEALVLMGDRSLGQAPCREPCKKGHQTDPDRPPSQMWRAQAPLWVRSPDGRSPSPR
jgi:hypothetical protein